MTKDSHATPESLDQELRSVKKAFEVLLLAIEAEGIDSASDIASRIVDRIDHIIFEMKNGYVQRVLDDRFRPFAEDKERFAEFKSSGKKGSSNEFIEIVSRLERHIAAVDKEMHVLMPPPPVAVAA